MPKVETIEGFQVINVSASVGKNAVNLKDDVIVVQALLKYVFETGDFFKGVVLPEPTGTMDKTTAWVIKRYQQLAKKNYGSLGNVVADGRISPAKGGRVPGKNNRYTIVLLNDEAELKYIQQRRVPGGFVNDICDRFPQVEAVLENSVGTLGLTLEPSAPRPRRVGSLRLALE